MEKPADHGGTGSLGAPSPSGAESRQPKKVIVLSRDEQKHHAMQAEFNDPDSLLRRRRARRSRMNLAFRGVDLVVHAGMKHVHICEYNPLEPSTPT